MKKLLSVILIAVLVIVSLVVSCKSTAKTTTPSTPQMSSTTSGTTTQTGVFSSSTTSTTAQSSVATTSKTTPLTSTSTTSTSTTSTTSIAATSTETFAQIAGLSSNITCMKYTMVMATTQNGSMSAVMYVKNKKMRMESSNAGVTTIVIIDMDAKVMYSYMPAQNMAMKMPYDPSTLPNSSDAADYQSSAAQLDPVFVGDETYDGKVCAVFSYSDTNGTYKMWVWKDKGLPLKIEVIGNTGTNTIQFKDYDFSDIPDSMFELPAGVQVIDAGGMPTGIPRP